MQPLTAISPIDGRYRDKVENLSNYFSESALIRYRVTVEVEYFIALCEIPLPQLAGFNHQTFEQLREIYLNFTVEDAQRIKDIEKVTNHDVKAVEYFIKEKFDALNLQPYKEFIHFGLTSQDINNTAVPCSFRDAVHDVYYPVIDELIAKLEELAEEWKEVPMLAKTHGQPASPTRLGKELKVFTYRLSRQLELLKKVAISGKFGGATGNFNAHNIAFPEIDWAEFGNRFLTQKLKIERETYTTQISNYDNFAALFDNLRRINNIIIDLDRDLWTYISMTYFKQKIKAGEHAVGQPLKLTCKCCGKEFESRRSNTLFCGPNCRAKFYRQEAAETRKRECVCENCGKTFTTTRNNAKYCCDECRTQANRKMQKERNAAKKAASAVPVLRTAESSEKAKQKTA